LKGADLKKIRNDLGLSLAQVARQLEISVRSIARWEASDDDIEEWKIRLYRSLKRQVKQK
jgi:DNA-binding transcriptional regulator YiaG